MLQMLPKLILEAVDRLFFLDRRTKEHIREYELWHEYVLLCFYSFVPLCFCSFILHILLFFCSFVLLSERGCAKSKIAIYLLGLISSFTGFSIFSGLKMVSSSSLFRMPCSSTSSYTLLPVSNASFAILVEFL